MIYRHALRAILLGLYLVTAQAAIANPVCAKNPILYLDIGHSLKHSGSTSARGKPEYLFNKRFVYELVATLNNNHSSFDIRVLNKRGEDLSLRKRAKMIRAIDSGILLSIHHDSVQPKYLKNWTFQGKRQRYSNNFHGFSLFVSKQSPAFAASQKLGIALGQALTALGFTPSLHHAEKIKGENRPLLDARLGLYHFDELAVLRKTKIPAVLIEVGIIVNQNEELELEKPAFRQRMIAAIWQAVASFCENSD